jgi:two-component system, sensor histidine kinase FlrB
LHEERQQLLRAARLSSLGTLAAGIAREFADPLADVTGLVDALRAGEVAAWREDEYFTAIEDRLDRMHGLLETVLDLARSPAPGPSRFVAGEVLASCRRLLAPVLRERGVELALVDVDQLVLHADRSLLLQAILDVLMYAVYAAPAGTAVTARVALDGDRCGLCITDRGPAALPDDLRCLGDAFVTMGPGEEGTGHGLSIARSILRAHGGDLAVESTPGQGTAVTLWLPRGLRGDAGAPR